MTVTKTKRPKVSNEFAVDKGYYIRSIGKRRTASGSIRAWTFYLGKVEDGVAPARLRCAELELLWQQEKAKGYEVWSFDPTATPATTAPTTAVIPLPSSGLPSVATSEAGTVPVATLNIPLLTVSDVRDLYIAEKKKKAIPNAERIKGETNGISADSVGCEASRMNRIVEVLGKQRPMSAVERTVVLDAVLFFAKRPLCWRNPKAKDKTKPKRMSKATAKGQLKTLRAFLRWAYRCDLWLNMPKDFDELFSANRPTETADERHAKKEEGDGVKKFTLEQLTKIYASATATVRLWCLLGLNCGFANKECASLRDREIKWGYGKEPTKIKRYRLKTQTKDSDGVWAEWTLWQETEAK